MEKKVKTGVYDAENLYFDLLLDAQFSIGSKLLIFEKEKRKLNLWILSCADVILKDAESLEKWACGFLNSPSKSDQSHHDHGL